MPVLLPSVAQLVRKPALSTQMPYPPLLLDEQLFNDVLAPV